jgi:hypothetical protein
MADDVTTTGNVVSWVRDGSLLAFAAAVLWEVRQLRPFLKSVGESLAILVDRLPRRPERPGSTPGPGE